MRQGLTEKQSIDKSHGTDGIGAQLEEWEDRLVGAAPIAAEMGRGIWRGRRRGCEQLDQMNKEIIWSLEI